MPPTTLFGLGYGTGPAGYGYPPGARRPSISYPDSPFTWYDHVEITAALPTNGGGPITNYSVLSGSLPAGVSLNATTGELTGTPTTQQSAASVVIRARGPGGVSDTTISVEVLAMPLSLGSSLAAWYKADAGCYTDAACLFASASSQYLSKTSPTFAPTTKMTIAVDFKPSGMAASHDLVSRYAANNGQFIFRVNTDGTVCVFIMDSLADSGGNFFTTTAAVVSDGVNARIVVIYDGTLAAANRVAVYVDGSAAAGSVTGTIPTSLTASTAALEVGRSVVAYINGSLARLGFSSQALSGAALTAAHTSTFWADMTAARQADWFSFYNLCEKDNTRVDSTGLNNLTPTNGPTVAAGPGEGAAVNNSPVKRWESRYGTSHLTQSDIAKQPLWMSSGGATGTTSRVLFDGVDNVLSVSLNLGAAHLLALLLERGGSASDYVCAGKASGNGAIISRYNADFEYFGAVPRVVITATDTVPTGIHSICAGGNASGVATRVDGAAGGTSATAAVDMDAGFFLGCYADVGTDYYGGSISEVVLSNAYSAGALASADSYLNARR